MSAKSEANIDRFCELTQSWLPMEKQKKIRSVVYGQ